jgi:hypothetical protein
MSRFRNWTSMIPIDQLPIRASYLTCYLSNTLILFQDVRSNLVLGEVCWIQHYVIKFVSDLWQVGESAVKHHNLNPIQNTGARGTELSQGMAIPCYERLWSSCGSLKGYSNIVVQKHFRCSIVFGYSIYVKPHIVLPTKWRKYIIWLGFTSPLIIEVAIPNKESERSCLWGSDFTPDSTSFQLEFGTVPAVW